MKNQSDKKKPGSLQRLEEIKNVPIRYNGAKYYLKLSKRQWNRIDNYANFLGDSRERFVTRLIDINRIHRYHPVLQSTPEDISDIGCILKELSHVRQNESSSSTNEVYRILNSAYIFNSNTDIKSDSDLLKFFNKEKEKSQGNITLNLRSSCYTELGDPLLWLQKTVSSDLDLKFKLDFYLILKELYLSFCEIGGVIESDDLELFSKSSYEKKEAFGLKWGHVVLRRSDYDCFFLSSNLFTQFCFFSEKNFTFSFLCKTKEGEEKRNVNFSTTDTKGSLIHYTSNVFCKKFNRNQNEMIKLILFLTMRYFNILDNDFNLHSYSRKFLFEFIISHAAKIIVNDDEIIIKVDR